MKKQLTGTMHLSPTDYSTDEYFHVTSMVLPESVQPLTGGYICLYGYKADNLNILSLNSKVAQAKGLQSYPFEFSVNMNSVDIYTDLISVRHNNGIHLDRCKKDILDTLAIHCRKYNGPAIDACYKQRGKMTVLDKQSFFNTLVETPKLLEKIYRHPYFTNKGLVIIPYSTKNNESYILAYLTQIAMIEAEVDGIPMVDLGVNKHAALDFTKLITFKTP